MSKLILPLAIPARNLIKAGSAIQSLHNIVEELCLNSLDANATTVEVHIDWKNFGISVIDNGRGICKSELEQYIGQFHCTSSNVSTYGHRGEALAALCVLCDVSIVTKSESGGETFEKRTCDGQLLPLEKCRDRGTVGTSVCCQNIFKNLSVRRTATKGLYELTRIKEFIQKMSLLHHSICWRLIDVSNNNKILMHLPPHSSVALRFCQLHSPLILSKMMLASATVDNYCLRGMLSPMSSEFCHWTKEYQYLYVNGRWMRNVDMVSILIDSSYSSLLLGKSGGGPVAKHHTANGPQIPMHPCFVLQLTCPPDSIDVLMEPDKSVVVFSEGHLIRRCTEVLLNEMAEKCSPNMLENFKAYWKQSTTVGLEQHEHSASTSDDQSHEPPLQFPVNYSISKSDLATSSFRSLATTEVSPQSQLFKTLFLESPLNLEERVNNAQRIEQPDIPRQLIQDYETSDFDFLDPIQCNQGDHTELNCGSVGVAIARNYDFKISNELEQEESKQFYLSTNSDGDDFGTFSESKVNQRFAKFYNASESFSASCSPFSIPNEESPSITSAISAVSPNSTVSIESSSKYFSAAVNCTSLEFPMLISSPTKISKEDVKSMEFIGQADCKYILGMTPSRRLIAFDQHAIHERINLESFQNKLCCNSLCVKCISKFAEISNVKQVEFGSVNIENSDAIFLEYNKADFTDWGFEFEVLRNNTKSGEYSLKISKTPMILGEELDVNDFLEFLQLLKRRATSVLVKPPAIGRILATKACRSSVRFGDSLSEDKCRQLLHDIANTSLPFQCAHGRTSVAPLPNLSNILENRLTKKRKLQSYTTTCTITR